MDINILSNIYICLYFMSLSQKKRQGFRFNDFGLKNMALFCYFIGLFRLPHALLYYFIGLFRLSQ